MLKPRSVGSRWRPAMSEGLVLTLDGSTSVCSAALLRLTAGSGAMPTWETVSRRDEADGRAQARVLLRSMDEMLRETDSAAADLRAIVVGVGPGTFTGVRITVATARAGALALGIPVVGVCTLAGLAAGAVERGVPADVKVLLPVVDARRGQVFYGVYRKTRSAEEMGEQWMRTDDYAVCDRSDMLDLAAELGRGAQEDPGATVLLVGDADLMGDGGLPTGRPREGPTALGLRACFRAATVGAEWLLRGQRHLGEPGAAPVEEVVAAHCRDLRGGRTAEAAALSVEESAGALGSPESVRPIYVRSPDADVHITKMRDPWGAR